jgi:hypothetical protein
MKMPRLIFLFALCALGGFALAAEPTKPNLIFILADDLRWDALGCMGNRTNHRFHLPTLCFLALLAPAAAAEKLTVYHIGNSLTPNLPLGRNAGQPAPVYGPRGLKPGDIFYR